MTIDLKKFLTSLIRKIMGYTTVHDTIKLSSMKFIQNRSSGNLKLINFMLSGIDIHIHYVNVFDNQI